MAQSANKTHYDILQVSPFASKTVIQGAYRALLKTDGGHPDLGGNMAEAQQINEAYAVLSNPVKRREYDISLPASLADKQPRVQPQYILICPGCHARNLVVHESQLEQSKCFECGKNLLPKRRVAAETDHTRAFRMGVFLFDKGLMPRARREFDSAVRLHPKSAKYHYWLGRTQYQMRIFEKSGPSFKKAITLRPQVFQFHFWLGQTYYMSRKYHDGLSSFTEAIRLRPDNTPTLLRMASCHFHLQKFAKTIELLEKAVRLDPGQMQLYTLLGVAHLASKNPGKALSAFAKVEEINPGNRLAQKYLKLIKAK